MQLDAPLSEDAPVAQNNRKSHIYDAEVRLLYSNANIGAVVTVLAATVLSYLQWGFVSHWVIIGWTSYMLVTTAFRFGLTKWHSRIASINRRSGTAFVVGVGLSAFGWAAAGVLLYSEDLPHQVFLSFTLGGMMLGAVSLLAPRPEAFLTFLLPTGLAVAVRLALDGDREHIAMGLLAGLFTGTAVATALRIHQTIESTLTLRFENQDLVDGLRIANQQADALNQQLESRVRERTAELQHSTELLRAEMEQRSEMEAELLRARKLESLGVLAGGIAHDFNNFLTILQGNIELAKLRLPRDHPVQDILQRTTGTCQRAAFLSSQLLTFAKGGAPVRRLVSLNHLLRDSIDLIRAGSPASITVVLPDDLWPAEIDPNQIGQVLHNILLNAMQAMPEGGMIEVTAANLFLGGKSESMSSPYVRISIRDYGCGISAEALPRIFDPYFTTKPEGTGLGLATAHSIVRRHAGHISVESTVGRGTVFTVDLPASQKVLTPVAPAAEELRRGSGRLLMMDDEEALCNLMIDLLTDLGYEVETARDGAEAIALYEAALSSGNGFAAVLLDVTVPGGMGGIEAARRLREIDPGATLIVSSGYSQASVMSEFRKYGFDAMVQKPWTLGQISQIFQQVLSRELGRTPG